MLLFRFFNENHEDSLNDRRCYEKEGRRPEADLKCVGGGWRREPCQGKWGSLGGASATQKFTGGMFVLKRSDWGRYKIDGNPAVGWGGSGQADIGNRFRGDPWKSRCALSMSNVNKMWL